MEGVEYTCHGLPDAFHRGLPDVRRQNSVNGMTPILPRMGSGSTEMESWVCWLNVDSVTARGQALVALALADGRHHVMRKV